MLLLLVNFWQPVTPASGVWTPVSPASGVWTTL